LLRLSIALACATLAVSACKKKEAAPADAGARTVHVPIAPAPGAPPALPMPAPVKLPPGVLLPRPHKTAEVPNDVPKTTLTTPPSKNVVPAAPHPKHQGAPAPGETVTDPEDVE